MGRGMGQPDKPMTDFEKTIGRGVEDILGLLS
jgi:hypothetical protein